MARHQGRLLQGILQRQRRRENVAHQPGAQRLPGGNALAGQHHFAGQGFPDAADKTLGAARAGHDAERDFRQAETGVVTGNHHVAQQRQLAARPQREAIYGGDQRFRKRVDPRPQLRANIVQSGRQVFLRHLIEIGPGSKAALAAVNHADGDVSIHSGGLKLFRKLGQQRVVEGVARRRTVQRQLQHAAMTGNNQFAHAIPFASKSTITSAVNGSDWQLSTYPAASSSGSRL